MKTQEATVLSASAVSGVAGFFGFIEQNAAVINIIISGLGVLFALVFGAVGWYSMHINRRKDKRSSENEKAIRELQKDNLRLRANLETIKIKGQD